MLCTGQTAGRSRDASSGDIFHAPVFSPVPSRRGSPPASSRASWPPESSSHSPVSLTRVLCTRARIRSTAIDHGCYTLHHLSQQPASPRLAFPCALSGFSPHAATRRFSCGMIDGLPSLSRAPKKRAHRTENARLTCSYSIREALSAPAAPGFSRLPTTLRQAPCRHAHRHAEPPATQRGAARPP